MLQPPITLWIWRMLACVPFTLQLTVAWLTRFWPQLHISNKAAYATCVPARVFQPTGFTATMLLVCEPLLCFAMLSVQGFPYLLVLYLLCALCTSGKLLVGRPTSIVKYSRIVFCLFFVCAVLDCGTSRLSPSRKRSGMLQMPSWSSWRLVCTSYRWSIYSLHQRNLLRTSAYILIYLYTFSSAVAFCCFLRKGLAQFAPQSSTFIDFILSV